MFNPGLAERQPGLTGSNVPTDQDRETVNGQEKTVADLIAEARARRDELEIGELLDLASKASPELIKRTRGFARKLSKVFKKEFLSLLEKYLEEERAISLNIISYLLDHKLYLPRFTIASGRMAKTLLQNYGLLEATESNSESDDMPNFFTEKIILSFRLPKPLATFWNKGGLGTWGYHSVDVENRVIEWGYFYRRIMRSTVWSLRDSYERSGKLFFRRLNQTGQHNSASYYYVWEVDW